MLKIGLWFGQMTGENYIIFIFSNHMRRATGNIGQMESWMAYDMNTICAVCSLIIQIIN